MNCIIIDDDKLQRKITEQYIEKTEILSLTGSFESAVEALPILQGNVDIHLIFLDIEMPEMTGLEFLSTMQNLPQIIIMSSKEKYALDAFDYDVTDYLLKPYSYARFYKAVSKANDRFSKIRYDDGIFVKNNSNSYVRLNYEDIFWVEALENYVVVHSFDDKFVIHYTMKAMEDKLPVSKFTRVHRSYIVNVSKITMIEDNNIVVKQKQGTKVIPIAKTYKDKLMTFINIISK